MSDETHTLTPSHDHSHSHSDPLRGVESPDHNPDLCGSDGSVFQADPLTLAGEVATVFVVVDRPTGS